MKCFWHSCVALVLSAGLASPVVAQYGGQNNEIGSYQSILSRAGYTQDAQAPAAQHQHHGHQQQTLGSLEHMNGGAAQSMQAPPMQSAQPAIQSQMQPSGVVGGNCNTGAAFNQGGGYAPAVISGGPCASGQGSAPIYGGNVGGSVVSGGFNNNYAGGEVVYDNGSYADYAYDDGSCGTGGGGLGLGRLGGSLFGGRGGGDCGGGGANTVFGANGLFFARDYEDDRQFSNNGAGGYLLSTDAENQTLGGIEFSMTRRQASGRGLDVRYWGLFPGQATASLAPAPLYTDLTGLADLNLGGFNVQQIFDVGEVHFLNRDTEIHNLEASFLRNGGQYRALRNRSANYELFTGFRWFQFNEDLRYGSDTTAAGYPFRTYLNSNVENTLLGLQVGGRTEVCLTRRIRFAGGTKVGLFNNRINAHQDVRDSNFNYATVGSGPYAGDDYNLDNQKNDISFLGEFNAGLIYQFSGKSRFNIGYRALGISGIALATDQVPYSFTALDQISRIRSNGSLLLHGGYAGFEFCY